VIKIRYADLPEGLHARAETQGGRTVICLRPGLTPAQRRAALRRLRRDVRLGKGPPLPVPGVTLAVTRDITKSTTRNGLAALRYHPVGSLFLTALAASVIVCYVLFVSVSVELVPAPPAEGALPAPRGAASGGQGLRDGTTSPGRQQVSGPVQSATPAAVVPAPAPAAASASAPSAPSALATHPVPLPTSSPSPSAAPSPAGPSPSPGGDPGGLCVGVGSLGVCLSA
jgi:hypothetical protein